MLSAKIRRWYFYVYRKDTESFFSQWDKNNAGPSLLYLHTLPPRHLIDRFSKELAINTY